MVVSSLCLILWFVVVVSSIRIDTEKITEQCSFIEFNKISKYLLNLGFLQKYHVAMTLALVMIVIMVIGDARNAAVA